MTPIKTILHPTDFSERSAYAYQLACALARDYGARLILLHVAALPTVAYGDGIAPVEPEGYWEELRKKLYRLAPGPKIVTEHRFEEGHAATVILEVAKEDQADLIVMGTHGRRGLQRLLMGSIAEEVMRRAACPVLTVRAPFHETAPVREELLAETAAS